LLLSHTNGGVGLGFNLIVSLISSATPCCISSVSTQTAHVFHAYFIVIILLLNDALLLFCVLFNAKCNAPIQKFHNFSKNIPALLLLKELFTQKRIAEKFQFVVV